MTTKVSKLYLHNCNAIHNICHLYNKFHEKYFVLRNPTSHSRHCELLQDPDLSEHYSVTYGVNRDSFLNKLEYSIFMSLMKLCHLTYYICWRDIFLIKQNYCCINFYVCNTHTHARTHTIITRVYSICYVNYMPYSLLWSVHHIICLCS